MKKKYIKSLLLSLSLLVTGGFTFAQNGLEKVIVERYYTSNTADAIGSIGALPAGSVTYRIYADMIAGYKFQALYGVAGHTLTISTSTSFFNNEDRGAVTPNTIGSQYYHNNSVALDSWFSAGAGATGQMGVLKSEDNGAANLITTNTMLLNNDGDSGIPLTTQDGMMSGTPEAVTFVGVTTAQQSIFDATSNFGNSFVTSNGSIASLNGSVGPTSTNRVLIGQFTTNGNFHFALNIQVGTGVSGQYQHYVASNPVGNEISIPSLTFDSYIAPPTVSNVTYCAGATASALTATPISGDTLRWYTTATGGTGSLTAPTPSTATPGTTTYYVSQFKGSSLSPRAAITVTVNAMPTVTVNSPSICAGTSATLTAAGATAYLWSTSATTGTITVTPSATTSYTVTGTSNGCSNSATSTVTVTVTMATPGVITGTAAVCGYVGTSTPVNYHITAVAGASSYVWSAPTGASIVSGQGSTSINVSYAGSPTGGGSLGNVSVVAVSSAGCTSLARTYPVSATLPAAPLTLTGTVAICAYVGTTTPLTYTCATVVGASSYTWTVPAGVTIVSGQGTTSLVVDYHLVSGAGALGSITAAAVSGCGTGLAKALAITRTIPTTPGVITGTAAVCNYVGTTTPVTYSIAAVATALSYTWTVPTGVTLLSGEGTTSITVDFHTLAYGAGTVGNITVVGNSGCGISLARAFALTKTAVAAPLAITGQLGDICPATNYTYSVAANAAALSCVWTVPSGASIASGQGTTSIVVNFPVGYVTGIISCKNSNNCSLSLAKSITVTGPPAAPGTISGTTVVCSAIQGATSLTYTIAPVTGVSSYLWNVPTGASIVTGQGTTSLTISFAPTFISGTLSVQSVGTCVNSAAKTLILNRAAAEPGLITGSTSICSQITAGTPVPYSVVAVTGATSYNWTIPAGASIITGAGTNSVTILFASTTPSGVFVKVAAVTACASSLARSTTAITTCLNSIAMNNDANTTATDIFSNLYPNPATDFLTVDVTSDIDKDILVQVYNVLGAEVVSQKYSVTAGVTAIKTDVSELRNGVFMVKLTDLSNYSVITKSMVK